MLSLKTKILLLALIPLVLMTAAITWISQKQARELANIEIATFEENLLASKQQQLKHHVNLATASVREIIATLDRGADRQKVATELKRVLHGLTFGEDGYFFVYDKEGVNLVHPIQPELVGQNLYHLKDDNGKPVIQEILQLAREGGGFSRYTWRRPTGNSHQEDKLSYVEALPNFEWVVGTGLYIDEIADEVAVTRRQVDRNIRDTFFSVLIILSGTVVMIILMGVGINIHATQLADRRLKELANRSVQLQVSQRRHFARELHDGVNQLMVAVKLRLNLFKREWEQTGSLQNLEKAGEMLDLAMQEVRRVSHDLRPILLDDLGLEAGIKNMLVDFAKVSDLDVSVDINLPEQRLPDAVEITLYRMVQEALTNVEKHADARQLKLRIWHRQDVVYLELEDDGKGFMVLEESQPDVLGIGLLNMRERTELLGGEFSITSRPKQGTLIRAVFFLTLSPAQVQSSRGEADKAIVTLDDLAEEVPS